MDLTLFEHLNIMEFGWGFANFAIVEYLFFSHRNTEDILHEQR